MIYSLPYIRDYVRSEFSQQAETGFISNAEIDRWVNEGYLKYCVRLMMANQGYFEQVKSLDITASTETIALPDNFVGDPSLLEVVILERVLTNSNVPLRYRKRYDETNPTTAATTGVSYLPTYDFRGNNLVLEPTPTFSETSGLRLVYKGLPPQLTCNNCAATDASDLKIDLAAGEDPRNDYFNGQRIYIYSGAGAGQVRTISDYVGSTKIATVSLAWTTKPDSTSLYSTLTHTDYPEVFADMLAIYATKKAFMKERSMGTGRNYDLEVLKEREKEFTNFCEERTQARKFVQPWNPELYY